MVSSSTTGSPRRTRSSSWSIGNPLSNHIPAYRNLITSCLAKK